jgi:FtsH-binding integral membrane protein
MCYLTFGLRSANFLTSQSCFYFVSSFPASFTLHSVSSIRFIILGSVVSCLIASVVDIFGQESRRLLQKRVSVSGIPKWKRTATSRTGCFVTVYTKVCKMSEVLLKF